MIFDPSIHFEIARQRQRDMLARSERHRLTKAALARRQGDRGRPLIEPPTLHEPSPTTTARPQRANA